MFENDFAVLDLIEKITKSKIHDSYKNILVEHIWTKYELTHRCDMEQVGGLLDGMLQAQADMFDYYGAEPQLYEEGFIVPNVAGVSVEQAEEVCALLLEQLDRSGLLNVQLIGMDFSEQANSQSQSVIDYLNDCLSQKPLDDPNEEGYDGEKPQGK